MSDYIRIFKGECDDLSAMGKQVTDRTKVFALLKGLGIGYESFVTTMLKPPTPSFTENFPLLQGHETLKNLYFEEQLGGVNPNMALMSQRSQGEGLLEGVVDILKEDLHRGDVVLSNPDNAHDLKKTLKIRLNPSNKIMANNQNKKLKLARYAIRLIILQCTIGNASIRPINRRMPQEHLLL